MKPAVRQLLLNQRQVCQVPSGFDWTPPITVYKTGRRFTTNYRAEDWTPVTTARLFVATTGNDTTGTGTEANPYKSVKKAVSVMVAATEILVKAGYYDRSIGWDSTGALPAFDFIVRGYGGDVTISTAWEGGVWTLTTNGTYAATRSAAGVVIDYAFLTSERVPTRLTKVATQALCEATAGTWATNGTTTWVHTSDGRSPDSNLKVLLSLDRTLDKDKKVFVQGINLEGGRLGAIANLDTLQTSASQLVMDNCKLTFSEANGLTAAGLGLVILKGCSAYGNVTDGFNYHVGSVNAVNVKAVEIDCVAHTNGDSADTAYNDNSSTSHENCRVVRIQTTGRTSVGPIFADINTTQTWNLGCSAASSQAVGAQNTGFQAGDTATQWMDSCTVTGCDTQASKVVGATQYQRNSYLGVLSSY